MTSIEDTLNKIYYDPSKGLVSEDKFYAKVKHLGITRKDVHEYIKKQKVNQLHKPVIIKHSNDMPERKVEAKEDRAKIDSSNRAARRVRKAGVDETNIINKIRSRSPKRHMIADEYMYE